MPFTKKLVVALMSGALLAAYGCGKEEPKKAAEAPAAPAKAADEAVTVKIGHVVGANSERVTAGLGEPVAGLVAQRFRLQAVRHAPVRGRPRGRPPGGQQNRRRRANRTLVRDQHIVRTAAVAQVLVDIYNRLARRGLRARAEQRKSGADQKVASFHRQRLSIGGTIPGLPLSGVIRWLRV